MYGACKLESNVNSILSNDTGAVCGRTVAGGTVYGACKFESNRAISPGVIMGP